ncbi:MAG TPA: hypothetical protein PLW65_22425 [Pseudomonadota bacterium]|nr:hypothetical protein [Pseudomonadota bacterium]
MAPPGSGLHQRVGGPGPAAGWARRAVLMGLMLLGAAGVISAVTCSTPTVPAGVNGVTNGLCTFPRGCYVVNASGPQAGQCDDCSSTASCRLVFMPSNPGDYQSLAGTWVPASGRPMPTDWQAICSFSFDMGSSGKTAVCAAPETVCIARGPACSGYCIHRAALGADGGASDMGVALACAAGVPVPPQRRPGAVDGGTQTYCPLTDDTCCPGPAPVSDGGAMDGGAMDGGAMDGGAADLAGRD